MNKKLSGIVGIILSIILLVYFESFFYKVLGLLEINVYGYSNTVQILINVLVKLVMCFIVYLIYRKDFRKKLESDNFIKKIFVFLVTLIAIVIGTYFFSYIINFIGDIFNITVLEKDFYNIFNKTLNFNLALKLIIDYLIIPFLYCSFIILSLDKLIKSNETFIIFSGLLGSIIYALTLTGTLGFVIINSLNTFLLFSIFAFLYRKNNTIWYVILLYSAYLISSGFIINYLGW